MKTFEIEVYELHTTKWRVKGETAELAVANYINNGNATMVDGSQEMIGSSDEGAPVGEMTITLDPDKLEAAGVELDDGRIPSIRNIEEADDDE